VGGVGCDGYGVTSGWSSGIGMPAAPSIPATSAASDQGSRHAERDDGQPDTQVSTRARNSEENKTTENSRGRRPEDEFPSTAG